MVKIEVYINNKRVDLSEDVKIVLDKVVNEYRNPTKKTGSFSYDLTLPATQNNKLIFNNENDFQVLGKFRDVLTAEIRVDDIQLIKGVWNPSTYTFDNFEGAIIGNSTSGEKRIADIVNEKLTLKEIQSFTEVPFSGDATVFEYLDKDLSNSEICFPYVANSLARVAPVSTVLHHTNHLLSYENFGVNHFVRSIVKNIFEDAGYSVSGNILNDFSYQNMVLLYSNEAGTDEAYNYGALNPLSSYGGIYSVKSMGYKLETDNYYLFVVTPTYGETLKKALVGDNVWNSTANTIGDLSNCLDSGVYTAKHTGFYDIEFSQNHRVYSADTPSRPLTHKQFTVFREITDEIIDYDYEFVPFSGFSNGIITDNSVLFYTTGTSGSTTVKLKKGVQYAVQVYIAVSKESIDNVNNITVSHISESGNTFNITGCSGKQLLNPADFLPDMTQLTFLNGLFKLFNLYYKIDEASKTITFFTRDEFYTENKENIVNIDSFTDVKQFKETPLDQNDILETYYKFADDTNDYILSKTDYLDRVNIPGLPDNVFTLPFSPLGFVKVPVENKDNVSGYTLIPSKIPSSDVVDSTLLSDFQAGSAHNLKPKICIYLGNMLKPELNDPDDPDFIDNNLYITFDDENYKAIPQLSFINITDQIGYSIIDVPATREFYLSATTASTIYQENNQNFLKDTTGVTAVDQASLSLTGGKSLFQNLYKDNLKVNRYSNYAEGNIKMNSILYNQLNGRNIIKAKDDLYLLESITAYEPAEEVARIKVYKLVS